MYGGTGGHHSTPTITKGLSPRVRGNHFGRVPDLRKRRSIPACTGEPGRPQPARRLPAVYPRVYGGTHIAGHIVLLQFGLSPRVRGNHHQSQCCSCVYRSIPACTGEPNDKDIALANEKVYPRVYGGTSVSARDHTQKKGLSPRVRGNRTFSAGRNLFCRSIPACTGEPSWPILLIAATGVYPRVYGGTTAEPVLYNGKPGLSPRVRGNPDLYTLLGC